MPPTLARAQPETTNARQLLEPRTPGEARLAEIWKDVLRAQDEAERAADHCDKAKLEQARANLHAAVDKARSIGEAARSAGKHSDVHPKLADWVRDRGSEMSRVADGFELRHCPEDRATSVSTGPAGAEQGRSPYAPRQASEAEQAKYVEEVETEFANVEDARIRKDCKGWKLAHDRLRRLMSDYKANTTGLIPRDKQFGWITRIREEERLRPVCADEEQTGEPKPR